MNEKEITINEMIARMVAEARRLGYSESSIWTNIQPGLRAFAIYYGKKGISLYDPEITSEYVGFQKERLSRNEISLLAEPDTGTEIGVQDQFLMIFLYDTGARIQEVLDVKICDVKVDRTPTVTLHGKGKKNRIVPLMKDTVKHLQNYMKVFHPGETWMSSEWLFYVERKGIRNAMCDDTARLRIQKYAASAREKCPDVPLNVHPHLWRHTRAMHLYQHGMDLTLISQWLGHKQLETTLIYAYADTEAKRKAITEAMASDPFLEAEPVNYTVSDEEILKRLYGL
ncbi:integrase [Clostridiaceae bacterium]|nr:integrase [Clostridiaceae bacterium]RKI18054.1 integrase [bacterium 1XD21-70]